MIRGTEAITAEKTNWNKKLHFVKKVSYFKIDKKQFNCMPLKCVAMLMTHEKPSVKYKAPTPLQKSKKRRGKLRKKTI